MTGAWCARAGYNFYNLESAVWGKNSEKRSEVEVEVKREEPGC